jgi:hypothetical protein
LPATAVGRHPYGALALPLFLAFVLVFLDTVEAKEVGHRVEMRLFE